MVLDVEKNLKDPVVVAVWLGIKYEDNDFDFAVFSVSSSSPSLAFRHSVLGSWVKGSTLVSLRKVTVMVYWQKDVMGSRYNSMNMRIDDVMNASAFPEFPNLTWRGDIKDRNFKPTFRGFGWPKIKNQGHFRVQWIKFDRKMPKSQN